MLECYAKSVVRFKTRNISIQKIKKTASDDTTFKRGGSISHGGEHENKRKVSPLSLLSISLYVLPLSLVVRYLL